MHKQDNFQKKDEQILKTYNFRIQEQFLPHWVG